MDFSALAEQIKSQMEMQQKKVAEMQQALQVEQDILNRLRASLAALEGRTFASEGSTRRKIVLSSEGSQLRTAKIALSRAKKARDATKIKELSAVVARLQSAYDATKVSA